MIGSRETTSRHGASTALIELKLDGGPQAACQAREQLAATNAMIPRSVRAEMVLLLTELVTNAVRHGGASDGLTLDVVVARSRRGLRVAVSDPGEGFEWRRPQTRSFPEESGYGLLLVDRTAERWGIERGDDTTTVWFELSPG